MQLCLRLSALSTSLCPSIYSPIFPSSVPPFIHSPSSIHTAFTYLSIHHPPIHCSSCTHPPIHPIFINPFSPDLVTLYSLAGLQFFFLCGMRLSYLPSGTAVNITGDIAWTPGRGGAPPASLSEALASAPDLGVACPGACGTPPPVFSRCLRRGLCPVTLRP